MVEYMTKVVKSGEGLTEEERNMFSVAFKNAVGERRTAWRIVSSLKEKAEDKGHDTTLAVDYLKTIREELVGKVNEVLVLVDEELIPKEKTDDPEHLEPKVFYMKMQGDYSRNLAEVSKGEARTDAAEKSEAAYQEAMEAAQDLPLTNPVRLGLALNFAIFQYDIKEDTAKACDVAKTAFDGAIAELDSLKEDESKESTLIMQLLRDDLTLWTSEE